MPRAAAQQHEFESKETVYGLSSPVMASGSDALVAQVTLEGPPVVETDSLRARLSGKELGLDGRRHENDAEQDINLVKIHDRYEAASYEDELERNTFQVSSATNAVIE